MPVEFQVEETFDELVQEENENTSEPEEDLEEPSEDIEDEKQEEESSNPDPESDFDSETEVNKEENKQESNKEEDNEEDFSFVEELQKDFGFEYENEYEDTWDGLKGAVNETAERLAENQLNQFMDKFPDIAQYVEYRVSGGDPKKYQEEVLRAPSYDDLDISEDDIQTQEQLVRERLKGEGYTQETINEEIEDYKSAGLLKKQAERSKQVLSKRQEKKQQQLIEQQKKKQQQQLEKQKQEQQEYMNLIQESSNLGGLRLPETKKDEFTRFMFEPTEEGVTMADQAWNNMSREDRLALEYLVYQSGGEGLDLSGLVDNLASTKNAKSISESLRKTRGRRQLNDKTNRTARTNEDFNMDDVNFDEIFNS